MIDMHLFAQPHSPFIEEARSIERQGEDHYRMSDIDEAATLWSSALKIRQHAFGDSTIEAAVGYGYQARYHNYMASPQLDHRRLARREAERAKRLLKTRSGTISAFERILILREFAYAFKVSEMDCKMDNHVRLERTRTYFREALQVANDLRDTMWIAQITHDIGNTFTDEVGCYDPTLSPHTLRAIIDSGLTHYHRSTALLIDAGREFSEAIMMDHLTIGLMYKAAYGADSAMYTIASYDRALATMHACVTKQSEIDNPLSYDPRIENKAQMVELLYLRALSFCDRSVQHQDPSQVEAALRSLEAAVPYWEAMLREYKSRELHKVIGSYSHFPFRYGTYLAAELFLLTGDSARLRQAIIWSDRNRNGMDQRDILRAGGKIKTSDSLQSPPPKALSGSAIISFHDHPSVLGLVSTEHNTYLLSPSIQDTPPQTIKVWGDQLRDAMEANDIRTYQRIAFDIYQETIGQLPSDETVQQLVIIPSAAMATIPFEALVTDTLPSTRWSELHFVQDHWQVRYARTMNEGASPTKDLADQPISFMVAQPLGRSQLPFAMKLAKQQNGLYDGPVTRARVTSSMMLSAPLHIATHAEIPSNPDALPYLLLDDGILTIAAIDRVRCESTFVVLSSCSSGLGRVYIGEGALSLAHSFLRSGADAVVQTLWPVDDLATSEILSKMYEFIDDGYSVSVALAMAKRTFVAEHADDALCNPFYWSGIVITGTDLRPISRKRWVLWPFVIAVLIGTMGYRSFKRSKRARALVAN